jgi:hypothetical protein
LVSDWKQALSSLKGPGSDAALKASLQRNSKTLEKLAAILTADPKAPAAPAELEAVVPLAIAGLMKENPGAEVRLMAAKEGTVAKRADGFLANAPELFISVTHPGELPLY